MTFSGQIQKLKEGNKGAQKALFLALRGRMFNVCLRYMKNYEDAEERLMDGFCIVFSNIASFHYDHDEKLIAWIQRIMINECIKYLRYKTMFSVALDSEALEIPDNDDVLNKLGSDEIIRLIQQLPPGYRTIFNMHVIDGIEHKEIAPQLGISIGTSKSQLSRAKQMLQKLLQSNARVYEQEGTN